MVLELWVADKRTNRLRQLKDVITPMQQRILDSVQHDIDRGKPIRKRILKARQMGCSTIIEAILFVMAFLRPRMRGLVLSHEQGASEHLLGITKLYWDTCFWHDAFREKHVATNKLSWEETGSLITISTANSQFAGVSRTIRFLHASECGLWRDPEIMLTGLNQAIPRADPLSMIFHESTARGVGNWWHKAWKRAVAHDDEFDALFFGWWEDPSYRASLIGHADDLNLRFQYADDEERTLARFLRTQGFSPADIKDKLIWRRLIIADECLGDIEKFHQEYPTTPEEAFVSSGKNIFPIQYLRAAYEPESGTTGDLIWRNGRPEFVPNPRGSLKVFVKPSADRAFGNYIIGGDPASPLTLAQTSKDYVCAQVLNRNTWEQCAVFREKMDAATFGEKLELLGRWYNDALIAPEGAHAGSSTIGVLKTRNYPHIWIHQKAANVKGQIDNSYGWVTNNQTKDEAISNLQKAVYDAYENDQNGIKGMGLVIHDEHTYTEMKEYVAIEGKGRYGNSDGTEHDDTVMALAIAYTVMLYEMGDLLGGGSRQPNHAALQLGVRPEFSRFEEQMGELGVREGAVMVEQHKMRRPGKSPWMDMGNEAESMFDESEW